MGRMTALVASAILAHGCAQAPAAPPEPKTDDEKAFYSMGVALSREIAPLHLTPSELEILKAGLTDAALGRPRKAEPEAFAERLGTIADERSAAAATAEKKAAEAFLAEAAAEEGARKLPTGLVVKMLREGTGRSPNLGDTVRVRYRGTLAGGEVIDTTENESEPASVSLARMIPCWSQALQLMKEGGKARLYCPSDLAYGDRGLPPRVPPGAALVFEVELIEITR
jgi:FKBP-type peptidyl-prolyl cis-trans isomerase